MRLSAQTRSSRTTHFSPVEGSFLHRILPRAGPRQISFGRMPFVSHFFVQYISLCDAPRFLSQARKRTTSCVMPSSSGCKAGAIIHTHESKAINDGDGRGESEQSMRITNDQLTEKQESQFSQSSNALPFHWNSSRSPLSELSLTRPVDTPGGF